MRHFTPFAAILAPAVALLLSLPLLAQDGAAIYKTKCLSCHGAAGSGRAAMKGTNLLTPESKARSDEELGAAIAQGGAKKSSSHAYERKGVTPQQVVLLVGYVRKLQKQSE